MLCVAPQNLPSWFRLMFHHEYHIALHSYIVMGSKYFGYLVFLKLLKMTVLTSCSSRILSSKPLDLSSSKVIAYLKIFYPSLWIISGLKFVIDYKKNHYFDSPVKIRVLLDQGYWSMYKSWFGSYNISLVFGKSLYKKLAKMPRRFEVLKMVHQSPKILTKIRVWSKLK